MWASQNTFINPRPLQSFGEYKIEEQNSFGSSKISLTVDLKIKSISFKKPVVNLVSRAH